LPQAAFGNKMIIKFEDIKEKDFSLVGGKAKNLFLLSKNKIPVPPWYVIPYTFFEDFLTGKESAINDMLKSLNYYNIDSVSASIKNIIEEEQGLNQALEDIISKIPLDFFPVSVRSSGIFEDLASHSFAGQYSSFMNLGKENLPYYILKCVSSVFNKQNIVYHNNNQLNILKSKVSVIIQKMIFSEKSGVMFTKDPSTGENYVVINAGYGQGEGVVSDKVKTDTYIYDKNGKKIKEIIEEKDSKMTVLPVGGLYIQSLEKEESTKAVLNKDEIKRLVDFSEKIEKYFGNPQDIEFAIKGNDIYILQSRAITTIKKKVSLTWDNSNIVESFSGPTTPLTFSFANEAYTIIYQLVLQKLGVRKEDIQDNEMIFTNMIGFINNRVYYSLNSWFKTLSFLPAYNANKGFMEGMMGVKDSYELKEEKKKKFSLKGIWEILKISIKLIITYVTHERNVKKFTRLYEKTLVSFRSKLSEIEHLTGYTDLYRFLKKNLLYNWITPINNDIFTMTSYGILKKLVEKIAGKNSGGIQNDLLSGEGDIESTRVTYKIWEIADIIKGNTFAKDSIKKNDPEEFISILNKSNDLKYIKEKLDDFFEEYGNRSVNELKLETPNLKETPEKLLSLIKQYVLRSSEKPYTSDQKIRKDAEAKIYDGLKKYFLFKRFLMHRLFKFVLSDARRFVKNRENMRFFRTNVFGAAKTIFVEIGRLFEEKNIIEDQKDIFFLTHNEIFSYIYGTSVVFDLKKLISLRKAEYKEFEYNELPERFETEIPPYTYLHDIFRGKEISNLGGIGCSPGRVRGKVQFVKNPYNVKAIGDIMIAERTDPGWLPVFPLFKALIIERGSMLSHSAIVAREMGIPAIVGARGVKNLLKDGDIVEMDGSTGYIKKEQ
jgi:pyruvate,water dikinase